jgi:hypothetical protein
MARRAALLLALLLPAAAAAETIAFDVTLSGLKVATLTLDGTVAGSRYAVTGVIRTTGAVKALRRVHYTAEAEGRLRDGRFRPARYADDVDTGRRRSATRITWDGGVPAAESEGEVRPAGTPPDPATQTGAVDPLTALFAGMRDTTRAEACALRLSIYDGRRASRATLSDPQDTGDGLVCTGVYTRLAGFTDREMAERRTFPFTAVYAADGDRLRLVELRTLTTFGPAVLRRK